MQSECFCFQEILPLLALENNIKSFMFVTKLSSLAFPRKNGQRPGSFPTYEQKTKFGYRLPGSSEEDNIRVSVWANRVYVWAKPFSFWANSG